MEEPEAGEAGSATGGWPFPPPEKAAQDANETRDDYVNMNSTDRCILKIAEWENTNIEMESLTTMKAAGIKRMGVI